MTPKELGSEGLRRTWRRWREIDGSSDDGDMIDGAVTAAELAMWVHALRELANYEGETFAGRDQDLLQGLRWARNRGVHGLIRLVEQADGAVYPRIYPRRYRHYAWSPLGEVNDVRAHEAQSKYEPAYASCLAGEPVRRTIYDAAQILDVAL